MDFNKFLLSYLVYSQTWLNLLLDNCQRGNITKLGRNKKTWGRHDTPSSFNFFVQNFCCKEVHVQVPFHEGGAPRA